MHILIHKRVGDLLKIKISVQELVSYTVISTKVGIAHMCEPRSPDIVDRGIAGQNIYIIIIISHYFILYVSTKIMSL